MRARRIFIAAGAAFLAVAVLGAPFWWNALRGPRRVPPAPEKPKTGKECVLPAAEMRANHMTLLVTWRDEVVRQGDRTPVVIAGKTYEKSLTGTCLKCHSNKDTFCDRCHNTLSTAPECFECHVEAPEREPWK